MVIILLTSCSGIYGDEMTLETLKDFHRRRVQILADSGADIIAFETVPNKLEAQVFRKMPWWHLIFLTFLFSHKEIESWPEFYSYNCMLIWPTDSHIIQ